MREVFNIVIYNWCTICPEWVVSTRKSNGWCLKLHWTSSYNQMCSLRFNTKHINKTSNIYYMTVPYIAWFHTPESSFRNTLSIKKNFNEIACIVSKIQDYIRTYSKTRLCIMFLCNASKSKKLRVWMKKILKLLILTYQKIQLLQYQMSLNYTQNNQ